MSVKLRRQKKQKTKPLRSSHPAPSPPPLLEGEDLRVARKGERHYRTKLKALLEPDYTGMFAAIEPDSGEYFLGTRIGEAIEKARTKYPDKLVHTVRIGFPAAVKVRNRVSL